MSTNIPVSQLNELVSVTKDDFISVVDSGSLTTFKVEVETVNDYFSTSGSVLSGSWATNSISVSYALNADTASYCYPDRVYEMTASWAISSSYARTASLAVNSRTASRLEGIGDSYEERMIISSSVSVTGSGHISLLSKETLTSSITTDGVKEKSFFFSKDYTSAIQPTGITGYGKTFQYLANSMVFDVGHDYVDFPGGPDIAFIASSSKGMLFQSDEAGNSNNGDRIGPLLFISSSGTTYGRTFEGYIFSSSIAIGGPVSFYGTASAASGSDYAINSPFPLPMASIVAFAGTPTSSKWSDWQWSRGNTYNNLAYTDFATQVTNSFGHQATVTESIFNSTRRVHIGVIAGSSGVLSILWNGTTTYYLNLTATTTYNLSLSGLSNNYNYPYTITDYGWFPNVSMNRNIATSASVFANQFLSYTLGTEEYRLPSMNTYFRTYTTLTPLNWAIRLAP